MDYYDEFAISHTASAQEIRASYKKLVRLVHPDHCADPELTRLAELQTKRLNGILEILLDPAQRRRYDATLKREPRRPKVRKSYSPWPWLAVGVLALICIFPWTRQAPAPTVPVAQQQNPPSQPPAASPPVRILRPRMSDTPPWREERTPSLHPPAAVRPPDPEIVPEIPLADSHTVPAMPDVNQAPPPKHLAGEWLFVPPSKPLRGDTYPPEYIDLQISESSGVLRGRYRARYRVADRAISPTVAFQFAGHAEPDRASLPWSGAGGARGEIELHLLTDGSLDVSWAANNLGTELGLISGSAKLVRKAEAP